MTIKEFSQLCGCNPQTLRYYDQVGLLKPDRVNTASGYRYYNEEQAVTFVKIRNLQKAGFTIEEIRELLSRDTAAVLEAFNAKLAEAEARLAEIKAIRASYQTEMEQIQESIARVRRTVVEAMAAYDPMAEFGLTPEEHEALIRQVNDYFDRLARENPREVGYSAFNDSDAPAEEGECLDVLHNPAYTVCCEYHGWAHVKDFFSALPPLTEGVPYALLFQVKQESGVYSQDFGTTVLGMLLARSGSSKQNLSCSIEESPDGENHFWLCRRDNGGNT